MSLDAPSRTSAPAPHPPVERREPRTLELLALVMVLAALGRPWIAGLVDSPLLQTWSTVFVSITVQALPFLTLGVVVSGLIAALMPLGWLARVLPRRDALAVPAAGLAGVALPGCECGAVPIAGRLTARGARPAPALAFMLAAPAVNPVVLVATAVAFPGQPRVVLARFAASLLTAVVVGWVWSRYGRADWLDRRADPAADRAGPAASFVATVRHDFLHAGGWLVAGAVTAATLQTVVPRSVLDAVADRPVLAVAALAVLAVLLAICSEADAFVAAGLGQFSLTARLVFLVVGPAVDVKLVALQAGTFGWRFAQRFAPLTMVVAVGSALGVAAVVL